MLAHCCAARLSRHELNRRYLEEIGKRTELPVSAVPFLARGIAGPDDLRVISEYLLADEDDAGATP